MTYYYKSSNNKNITYLDENWKLILVLHEIYDHKP